MIMNCGIDGLVLFLVVVVAGSWQWLIRLSLLLIAIEEKYCYYIFMLCEQDIDYLLFS